MSKKIVIMGGGIGGLALAAVLSDEHDVTIIERNDSVGGQARSKEINGVFTEYCWHAMHRNYDAFFKLLSHIGLRQCITPIRNYYYLNKSGLHEHDSTFLTGVTINDIIDHELYSKLQYNFTDIIWLLRTYTIANVFSPDILYEQYHDIPWKDFAAGLSGDIHAWLVKGPTIYLGMDYDNFSTYNMLMTIRSRDVSNSPDLPDLLTEGSLADSDFYSFAGPIHKRLFDPLVKFLKIKGAQVMLESEIVSIHNTGDLIDYIMLEGGKKITADIFVNSLPIESAAKLLCRDEFDDLAIKSRQIQTQVLLYLDTPLNISGGTIITFPDSPWMLMIRQEHELWGNIDYDILSVGIGIWSIDGLNGKPASLCSPEELYNECIDQIFACQDDRLLDIKLLRENIHPYSDATSVWPSFIVRRGELTTYEPKFSNNVGTEKLRPHSHDLIYANLYHASGYVYNENSPIFNMNLAVESAFRVNNLIGPTKISSDVFRKPSGGWSTITKCKILAMSIGLCVAGIYQLSKLIV